jgi:Flp pilus assembly protein TadD
MSDDTGHVEHWGALVQRGRALAQVGRLEEALSLMQKAAGLAPDEGAPRSRMALLLGQLGRNPEALEAAAQGVALSPDETWPLLIQSLVQGAAGREREALATALSAVALEPDSGAAHRQAAHAACLLKDWKTARPHAERALELDPDDADSHEELGRVLLGEKNWTEAEAALRQAIAIDGPTPELLNDLAVAVERQGRKKEAVELLHDAARAAPDDGAVRENLSQATKGYIGAGVLFAVWVTAKLTQVLGKRIDDSGPWPWILLGGFLIGLGIIWWVRRRRLAQLHPTVRAFHAAESERTSPPGVIIATLLLLPSVLIALVWGAGMLTGEEALRPGSAIGWSVFGGILGTALLTSAHVTRHVLRLRRERKGRAA